MEKNDRRIKIGKAMLEAGRVESFVELESIITINFMREALGKKNHRPVKNLVFSPENFTIKKLVDLAQAIGCDPNLLVRLALNEYLDKLEDGTFGK